MTNAQHAPAPWKLCSSEQDHNFQIVGADSLPVAVMHTQKSSSLANWGNKKVSPKTLWTTTANEREQANANLIAASPDLLSALETALTIIKGSGADEQALTDNFGKQYAKKVLTIRAALAKARKA